MEPAHWRCPAARARSEAMSRLVAARRGHFCSRQETELSLLACTAHARYRDCSSCHWQVMFCEYKTARSFVSAGMRRAVLARCVCRPARACSHRMCPCLPLRHSLLLIGQVYLLEAKLLRAPTRAGGGRRYKRRVRARCEPPRARTACLAPPPVCAEPPPVCCCALRLCAQDQQPAGRRGAAAAPVLLPRCALLPPQRALLLPQRALLLLHARCERM